MHDTVPKTYRHLNFFQHECHLQVRTPRVKLPNGSVRLKNPGDDLQDEPSQSADDRGHYEAAASNHAPSCRARRS